MKKFLAILSLTAFVAVNVAVAQAPQAAAKETKKEAVAPAPAAEKTATHSCCKASSKSCTAEQMKSCTPAQKAACAKGEKVSCTPADKAKAEAGADKKEATKATNNN